MAAERFRPRTTEAWGQRPDRVAVRPEIAASWARCFATGLARDGLAPPQRPMGDAASRLVDASASYVECLGRELAGTGVAVVLSDARAVVVECSVTDDLLARRLDDVMLAPGYLWAVDAAGTNALGVASEERRTNVVAGPEHFMHALGALTTAAAPLCDQRSGDPAGALTLVCSAETDHRLLLPVARHAARELEQQLAGLDDADDPALVDVFREARRRTRRPLVLVGSHVLMMNAAAARIFTPADRRMLWEGARRATAARQPTTQFPSGDRLLGCTVEPVRADDEDDVVAALLRFTVSTERSPRADRATFGWDSLTDTELALADLVASGLTNRHAAGELFLSRHTVDAHLRHIFRKLGINSRVELARIVATDTLRRVPSKP